MGLLLAAVVVVVVVAVVAVVVAVAVATALAANAVADALTDAEADAAAEMSEDEAAKSSEECADAAAQEAVEEAQEGLEPPIVSHLWQEYHKDAPGNGYTGPTGGDAEHTKVAEKADDAGALQPKATMHLCFLESAIATVEAQVPEGEEGKYKMRWWIQHPDGTIQEHPDFTEAKPGTLKTGKYAWRWDGKKPRKSNGNGADRVYCSPGAYTSQIEVTDGSDTPVIAGGNCARTITLEGDPYATFIHALPKSQAEIEKEYARHSPNRWLSTKGRRFPSDCWVAVYQGKDSDPGHMVSLAHGGMEPTSDEGIAVPYGRAYKGWVRPDRHGEGAQADCIQLQDVGKQDGTINLTNPNNGGPKPTNPGTGGEYKQGVQFHREYATTWVGEGSSEGCARVWPEKEADAVSAEYGGVRCSAASFGTFGTSEDADGTWEIKEGGPPFVNKQTKRSRVEDAHVADSHSCPELNPLGSGTSPDPDEPLHMQDTFQKGAFGGFLSAEIPQNSNVQDEPDGQLRIRATYEAPETDSMYYVYHRAVAFGHSDAVSGTKHTLHVWIPHKVLRTWNGQRRNLEVKGCQVAWFVERRWVESGEQKAEVVERLGPPGADDDACASLPSSWLGKAEKSWDPGSDPQPAGEYYSVFKYKVRLRPYGGDDQDMWEAEEKMNDFMSDGNAEIPKEEKTDPDANDRIYVTGRNELKLQGIATSTP